MPNEPQQSNPLGNASLALGIASLALVFGIGLCAVTGRQADWLKVLTLPLYVCGGSSGFSGMIGMFLGFAGLLGHGRSRATAIVGMVLGLAGLCLFFAVLSSFQ